MDQNNSEYGYFLRSEALTFLVVSTCRVVNRFARIVSNFKLILLTIKFRCRCLKGKKQSSRGVQASGCNFIKKETQSQVFSFEFCEISNNAFFYRTHLVAASEGSCISYMNHNPLINKPVFILHQNNASRLVFVLASAMHCNFFIILPILLKIYRSNYFPKLKGNNMIQIFCLS